MTTMATLNDVRSNLIQRGYPPEQVDAMLDLAGRMMLEGALASKDDLNQLRNEFAEFKVEMNQRFAEVHVEMNQRFAEMRVEMNQKFAEMHIEMNERLAEMRVEMNQKFDDMRVEMSERLAEMRVEMSQKFAEQDVRASNFENRIIKWVFGAVFAGVVLNTGITSLLLVILPRLVD